MPNTVTGSTTNYVNYGIAAGVSGVTISEFLNNIVVNNNVGTGTFGFYVNTTTNISGGTVNNNNYQSTFHFSIRSAPGYCESEYLQR